MSTAYKNYAWRGDPRRRDGQEGAGRNVRDVMGLRVMGVMGAAGFCGLGQGRGGQNTCGQSTLAKSPKDDRDT